MDNSNFIRILYSTDYFTLNGLYVKFCLHGINIEKFFNKYKCNFDQNLNKNYINKLIYIENTVIQTINNNKIPQYRIKDQLHSGYIKTFMNNMESKNIKHFILKISGIWETESECGLTFKFLEIED